MVTEAAGTQVTPAILIIQVAGSYLASFAIFNPFAALYATGYLSPAKWSKRVPRFLMHKHMVRAAR